MTWCTIYRAGMLQRRYPFTNYLQLWGGSRDPHADNVRMPRTVLIVEDVETCAATLEIAFSAVHDIDVVTVMGGEQAWRAVQRAGNLAAIVTDLQMPDLDGYELIERVRAHDRHGSVPIVVITGSSDPDVPERVQRLGANAFFSKPYSPVAVREKLEQLLESHDSTKN
jgi:CheY-like chemotaxis protein